MIETFELAKSSNSKCKHCQQPINAGDTRGIEFTAFNSKSFYCIKCSETMINNLIEKAKKHIIIN